jgi:hypothetical protein
MKPGMAKSTRLGICGIRSTSKRFLEQCSRICVVKEELQRAAEKLLSLCAAVGRQHKMRFNNYNFTAATIS